MKTRFREKLKQKIIIPIIIVLSFNFIVPNYSQASLGGVLVTPVVSLLAVIGDALNRLIFLTVGETFGEKVDGGYNDPETKTHVAENEHLAKYAQIEGWMNNKYPDPLNYGWNLYYKTEYMLQAMKDDGIEYTEEDLNDLKKEIEEQENQLGTNGIPDYEEYKRQRSQEHGGQAWDYRAGATKPTEELTAQQVITVSQAWLKEMVNFFDENYTEKYALEEIDYEDSANIKELYYKIQEWLEYDDNIKGPTDLKNYLKDKQITVNGITYTYDESLFNKLLDIANGTYNTVGLIQENKDVIKKETLVSPIKRAASASSVLGTGIKAILGVGEYSVYLNDYYKEKYCELNPPEAGLINKALSMKGDETLGVDDEIQGGYGIPNIAITPAEIFSNKISMLNANYFKSDTEIEAEQIGGTARSVVAQLKEHISKWYNTLRLIAIFGLLSVLVYIGIRIMLSSSAGDKAKYKERLQDWLVAMCLIFFLHYIMVFTMTVVDEITAVIAGNSGGNTTSKQVNIYIVDTAEDKINIEGVKVPNLPDEGLWNGEKEAGFSTSLMGYMRLTAEHTQAIPKLSGVIMYLALTFYTVYFIFIYLKRLLTLTFLTVTAPLVALTYPLDKLRDGKAQAFNFWLREYMINALLPIIHLILYTILVSNAMELAATAPLYAIVALAFIVPAEKIVKEMFGFKASMAPAGGAAGIAGGYLALQGMNMLARRGAGGKAPKGGAGAGSGGQTPRIRTGNPNAGQVDSDFSDLALGAGADNSGGNSLPPAGGGGGNNPQSVGVRGSNNNPPPVGGSGNNPDITGGNAPVGLTAEEQARFEELDEKYRDDWNAPYLGGNLDEYEEWQNLDQKAKGNNIASQNAAPIVSEQENSPVENNPSRREQFAAWARNQRDKVVNGANDLRNRANAFADDTGKGKLMNNAAHLVRKRYRNAGGAKGIASKAGRKLGRAAVRGTVGVAGASVGLAAGMVGGNLSDMWKGLAGGAIAGNMMGKNLANRVERKASSAANTRRELWKGEQEAEAEAKRREFASNEENIKFIRDKYKNESDGPKTTREIKDHLKNMAAYERAAGGDIKKMDKLYGMEKKITGGLATSGKEFKALPQEEQQNRLIAKDRAQRYVSQIAELSNNYSAQDFRGAKYEESVTDLKNKLAKEARLSDAQADAQARKVLKDIRSYKKY